MKKYLIDKLKILLDYLEPPLMSSCSCCGADVKIRDDNYFYGKIEILSKQEAEKLGLTHNLYAPICASCSYDISTEIAIKL